MAHQRQAWIVMLAAPVAGVAVTANQFQVPPALPAWRALRVAPRAGH